MFSHYFVMSQKEAEKYCIQAHPEKSIIISICNSFDMDARLSKSKNNKVIDILRLAFDDVFKSELVKDPLNSNLWIDRYGRAVTPIDESDCMKIHDFIMKYHKSDESVNLIIHCEMGVSRSAAVMAAVLKVLTNSDKEIFGNAKFRPNPDVYREVLNYFMIHKINDSIAVDDLYNLRFKVSDTPFGYSPNFEYERTDDTKQAVYAPFTVLCDIVEKLTYIKETVPYVSFAMPFYLFNFATIAKDKKSKKNKFFSYFKVDEKLLNREEITSYKDTVAHAVIKANEIRQLPYVDTLVHYETEDGIEYEVTDYFMTLGNINSPYFYQKTYPYDVKSNVELENILLELEYKLPNGYHTWCYIQVPDSKQIKDETDGEILCLNQFYGILQYCLNRTTIVLLEPVNFITEEKKIKIIFNSSFWCDFTKKPWEYKIIAQKLTGETAEITYDEKEWLDTLRSVTNVRLVNFKIKEK